MDEKTSYEPGECLQATYLKKKPYLEYLKNFEIPKIKQTNNPVSRGQQRLAKVKRHEPIKRYSLPVAIRKMQIETTMTPNADKEDEKLDLLNIASRNIKS